MQPICVAHLAGLQAEGSKHCLPEQPKQSPRVMIEDGLAKNTPENPNQKFFKPLSFEKKKAAECGSGKEAVRGRAQYTRAYTDQYQI